MENASVVVGQPPKKRVRKSRGKGLRVKTGYLQCRTRHLKCREEKPSCGACVRAQVDCVYASGCDAAVMPANDAHQQGGRRSGSQDSPSPSAGTRQFDSERSGSVSVPESAQRVQRRSDAYSHQGPSPVASDHRTPGEYPLVASEGLVAASELKYRSGGSLSGTSPVLTGPPQSYTAEAASLRWFGLLATDQDRLELSPSWLLAHSKSSDNLENESAPTSAPTPAYRSHDHVVLGSQEMLIFRHFVQSLSSWIYATDPDRLFSVLVPSLAMRNRGLMSAILAFSARHLSLHPEAQAQLGLPELLDRNVGIEYYHDCLQYLQMEMKHMPYLTSDELLATVLTISSYEMIDESNGGWERHLKGVFWIQRSQLIHGESQGLKKSIWWSWLRYVIESNRAIERASGKFKDTS